jgi:hypothetical protein
MNAWLLPYGSIASPRRKLLGQGWLAAPVRHAIPEAERHMPPVGTRLDSCPNVRKIAGDYSPATPIPAAELPPPARRLTAADVGPAAR